MKTKPKFKVGDTLRYSTQTPNHIRRNGIVTIIDFQKNPQIPYVVKSLDSGSIFGSSDDELRKISKLEKVLK